MPSRRSMISGIENEFRRYKEMGEGTVAQLSPEQLVVRASPESNSIATIMWHVAGNLVSRFTDFLDSDGEKPWRDRESEFEERNVGRKELLDRWDEGWATLFAALEPLTDDDLSRKVSVRGVDLTVGEALLRALPHVSSHVGQIAFFGKVLRGPDWEYLTIPPGGTAAYNANPKREKGSVAR